MLKFNFTFFFLFLFCLSIQSQIFFEEQANLLGVNVIPGDAFLGNGVSFCDFNDDGWDDLTFATEEGQSIKFYKNVNGFFVEQNMTMQNYNFQTKQINWVDFDNDGDKDLFVTSNVNGNRLYENIGNFELIDITFSSGLPSTNFETYGASWGDFNNDGNLDVFLSNRVDSDQGNNFLFKNNGDGTFTNVNNEVGIDNLPHMSFCSIFFDFNNDGWQDIYVSNDKYSYSNLLYKNNGDGTFTDVSASSGTDIAIDAMTTTVGDFNNDGWFDIYVTNTNLGNVLFKNNGDETFTDIANASGTLFSSVSWGAVFLDAENDMDLDLYVSGSRDGSDANYLSAAFYENLGNENFSIPSSGFNGDMAKSYSNAIGDSDNDGFPEIVVNNGNNYSAFLWKNSTVTSNNWLKVKLEGTTSNKDGIGSVIEIGINGNKQYRYTHCGEGYLSQNSVTEIFGLGNNLVVDYVKITWLSGIEDVIFNVNANQLITIIEGSSELSISDYVLEELKYYPNPVKDSITLESQQSIDNVNIYNALGQIVLSKQINSLETEVDMSFLQNGVYFIKLFVGNSIETFRVIKN